MPDVTTKADTVVFARFFRCASPKPKVSLKECVLKTEPGIGYVLRVAHAHGHVQIDARKDVPVSDIGRAAHRSAPRQFVAKHGWMPPLEGVAAGTRESFTAWAIPFIKLRPAQMARLTFVVPNGQVRRSFASFWESMLPARFCFCCLTNDQSQSMYTARCGFRREERP